MPLSDYRLILADKLRDTAGKIGLASQNTAIQEALKVYSRSRPQHKIQELTGDGATFTFALASDFEEGFSSLASIEHPVDQQDPEYLDGGEYALYRDKVTFVLKLRFLRLTIANTKKAYVTYSLRHAVADAAIAPAIAPGVVLAGQGAGNVNAGQHRYKQTYTTAAGETDPGPSSAIVTTTAPDGKVQVGLQASGNGAVTGIKVYRTVAGGGVWKLLATLSDVSQVYLDNIADGSLGADAPSANTTGSTTETVPVADRDAIASLAAAIIFRQLAALYTQTSDPTIAADVVNYRTKGQEYLALAKALEEMYRAHLGISGADMTAAASVIGDLDAGLAATGGGDGFFHSTRSR